jgi:hypothetical protein
MKKLMTKFFNGINDIRAELHQDSNQIKNPFFVDTKKNQEQIWDSHMMLFP